MKIWLLARHLPPEPSGGARRPFALMQGLKQLGHDVLMVGPQSAEVAPLLGVPHPVFPNRPIIDPNVRNKQATSTPKDFVMDKARRHLLLPDPEIRWASRLKNQVLAEAKKDGPPNLLITTSPPESLHIVGAKIKEALGCKWVCDVRDLWIERPQRHELQRHWWRRAIEAKMARWAFSKADGLVAVSQVVLDEALNLAGPRFGGRGKIVGHFSEPFSGTPILLAEDKFNIVHTGSVRLSNPLSDIEPLARAFEDLLKVRANAHLWLVGALTNEEKSRFLVPALTRSVTFIGLVSREAARAYQAGGDALAIVSGPESHALPGKFSEYELTGLPILLAGGGPWRALVSPLSQVFEFDAAYNLSKAILANKQPSRTNPAISAAQDFLDIAGF